jgi:hypothetical protein
MITYELARQLRDAGFPLKVTDFGPNEKVKLAYFLDGIDAGAGYLPPNLSELIEACGEGFGSLELDLNPKEWIAHPRETNDVFSGSTPEEAVARLWLLLNQK